MFFISRMAAPPALEKYDTDIEPLTLPMKLNTIGIYYELRNNDNGDPDGGNNFNNMYNTMHTASNTINGGLQIEYRLTAKDVPPVFKVKNFENDDLGPYMNFNGGAYHLVSALKPNSAFGRMFVISNVVGKRFILKVCKASSDELKKNVISETLIQHIIYETTKNNNHYDCPYAMKIESCFKLRFKDMVADPLVAGYSDYIGIIMEEGKDWKTIETHLNADPNPQEKNKIIIKICRMLQRLQEMYAFAHGDLHLFNTYYNGDAVKLIDFGRSHLNISDYSLFGDSAFANVIYGVPDTHAGSEANKTEWYKKTQKFDIAYLVCSLKSIMKDIQRPYLWSAVIDRTIGLAASIRINHMSRRKGYSYDHHAVDDFLIDKVENNVSDDAIPVYHLFKYNDVPYSNRAAWCKPAAVGGFMRSISRRKMKRTLKNKIRVHKNGRYRSTRIKSKKSRK